MSLNTLNKTVRTSSATLTGVDSKDSIVFMSRLNRDDFNIIGNYINNVAVRALRSLTSSPTYPHDALDNGISGMTVITYPEDLGNSFINSEMFWKQGTVPGTGRPCTIKESFDYVLANLTQQIVQVVERTEDITGLIEELKCAGFNNLTIKNEVLGQNYPLLCNGETIGSYPIAKHIYELFNQVIGGHNIENLEYLDNGDTSYPNLTFALPEIVVSDASETVKGLVELATVAEVIAGTSGVFSITPDKLVSAIQANGILRDKIKLAALEQINESSVFELSDVDQSGVLFDKQSLMFSNVTNKFSNRYIVWNDIMSKPNLVQNLNDLGDVVINQPEANHIIYYDGDKWRNRVSAEESIDSSAVEYLVRSFLVHDNHTGINFVHNVSDQQIIGTVEVSDLIVNVNNQDSNISLLENQKLKLTNTDDNIIISGTRNGDDDLVVSFDLNSEITASTITANVITANTFIGTIENAVYAQTANYANYLNNPDNIILAGVVTGTGDFPVGGTGNPTNNIVILTSLTQGSVTNDKLANDKITLTAAGTTGNVPLGGNITLLGTPNEIDLAYGPTNNVVSFSLPENINANASSADKLKTPRNITLTGGVTGSGSFDGSGNLNITTTVASTTTNLSAPTNTVRGGVLLAGTGSDNASGYIQRRNIEHFSAYIEKNFYINSSVPIHPGGIHKDPYTISNHRSSQCFVIFRNMSNQVLTLSEISFNFVYGGLGTAANIDGFYQFGLAKMSMNNNGFITIQSLNSLPGVQAPSTFSQSGWGFSQNLSIDIPPKQHFGVTCIKHPDKNPGYGLTVQISGSTPIGNYLY